MMSYVFTSAFTYFVGCCTMMEMLFFMKGTSGLMVVVEWESSEKFFGEVGFPLVVDWTSCAFLMTVFYISGCVSLFSGLYMSHENNLDRFLHVIQGFVVSMAVLIMFPGYMGLMIGWDGLGIVSFLLVLYYSNCESSSAALITAISNRVGDVFFILSIGVLGSSLSYNFLGGVIFGSSVLGMFILVGSITKSAQVPFSAWLPEAMAAPTPVSTLVHSSTLVTAGVYVLIRFSDYLGEFEKTVLMGLCMMTMLLAGSGGMRETDAKKVVALSTLSQVGMMMFSISVGATSVAFFHLLVHACFKALMFMCVGGMIYYSGGVQDLRMMGGLWNQLPLVGILVIFSNMSLVGFPFFSGFYSKELILSSCLMCNHSVLGFMLLLVSLSQTFMYASRMIDLILKACSGMPLSYYKMSSGYYLSSLLLMSHGAVVTAVALQRCFSESMGSNLSGVSGDFFYLILGGIVVTSLNGIFFFILAKMNMSTKMITSWLMSSWFLKWLSGNFTGGKLMRMMSRFAKEVETGWVRSYIWQEGLRNVLGGASNIFRTMNFSSIGLLMFYCICFFVLVFL